MVPVGDGRRPGGSGDGEPPVAKVRLVVASVVVLVWAVIYLRAALDSGFSPPPELSMVMLAVVAWLFGSAALKGGK